MGIGIKPSRILVRTFTKNVGPVFHSGKWCYGIDTNKFDKMADETDPIIILIEDTKNKEFYGQYYSVLKQTKYSTMPPFCYAFSVDSFHKGSLILNSFFCYERQKILI